MRLRESDRRIWAWVFRATEVPSARWFVTRYLDAASAIVMAQGPRWSRRIVLGRPIGSWGFAVLLLGLLAGVAGWASH